MNEYYDREYQQVIGDLDDPRPLSRRMWLSWEDLRFQVARSHGIWGIQGPSNYEETLKGVWGGAGPGEIVAILGELGSGKSLILNILAGNVKMKRGDLLTGRVLVNGFQRGERWRRLCSLATQSPEEYHGLLTVQEQIKFRSEVALPSKWSHSRRMKVVNWVLESMDLQSVKDTAVDATSLCERRRLSIGLSLVGLPRVLLLDEPTEGLDPTRALELLKTLRRITERGQITTIITAKVLREAALPLINRFLLIAQGSEVYYGNMVDAKFYFGTRLHISIPEKGDNPLTCMLDAISCIDCRRNPNHVERFKREWESFAFENQLYRTNYPHISTWTDGKSGCLLIFTPFQRVFHRL